MPEDAWDDDVVLEQAHADDDHGGEDGEVGRHGEADPHCKDPGDEWSDDGHDLHDAGEDADEEPVRQADRPETGRDDGRNDDDENRLAAYEGPQPKLDQRPRITDGLAFRPWQERADEIDGALTLEDPVRRRREHEEHSDDHLERDPAVLERGVDQT